MKKLSPLAAFAVSALVGIIVLTAGWSLVSRWTSYPVAILSHMALEWGAPGWVHGVKKTPGLMEVETNIQVLVPGAGGRRADIVVDAVPSRYAYGLPVFLALLIAARRPKLLLRAAGGYLLLLPAQAFSLTFFLLMQMVLAAQGDLATLKVAPWQLDAIAYGFQLGSLVVPTLAPILLWLWLDRQFFAEVVQRAWRATPPAPASNSASDEALAQAGRSEVDQADAHRQDDEHSASLRVLKAADHFKKHHPDAARADHPHHRS